MHTHYSLVINVKLGETIKQNGNCELLIYVLPDCSVVVYSYLDSQPLTSESLDSSLTCGIFITYVQINTKPIYSSTFHIKQYINTESHMGPLCAYNGLIESCTSHLVMVTTTWIMDTRNPLNTYNCLIRDKLNTKQIRSRG